MTTPCRVCLYCGAASEIQDDEAVWPAEWSCPACNRNIEMRDGIPIFAPALADTATGMDPNAFEQLAQVENGNFWFVPRNRLITGLLERYFADARSFMEVGCGGGFVLSAIAAMKPWHRVVASELHPTGLAIARARLGRHAEFVQMDARDIPARDVFDVIGAFDVLEHIDDDRSVLAAMYRALRADGGVLLAVPQHPWLWSGSDEYARHVRRYRRGELEHKVRAAGFRVLFSGSYTALLLPAMMLSRWAKSGDTSKSLGSEFALPSAVNGLFKIILQSEVTFTLAGVRFPAGGSRLVVAAK